MHKFSGFTQKANNAINYAIMTAEQLGHTYVGSEHLLLGLLREGGGAAGALLSQRKISYEEMTKSVTALVGKGIPTSLSPENFTPRSKKILESACAQARGYFVLQAGPEHILLALLREKECSALRLLQESSADTESVARTLQETLAAEAAADPTRKAQARPTPRGGKTANLDKYGRDITELARQGRLDPVIGREKETDRVIQILCRRTKNNPCLIGETGVGKTAIVEGLAQRIVHGEVPPSMLGSRVISLDLTAMVAGTKYRGDFEERIKNTIDEVVCTGGIILFIDELHTIIGIGAAEGAVDAANILKPQLARGELQLVGATTIAEYRKTIEKDSALERRFQCVMVDEPSPEETVRIMEGLRERYEKHHGVAITDEAIQASVQLSRRYLADRYLPDKAIDLLDEAAARVRTRSAGCPNRKVTGEDVAQVVSVSTGIQADKITQKQSLRYRALEEELHKKLIGQDPAVGMVARAIRRSRVGLGDPGRPIASFLFLGPTGVGKTQLCRSLGEALFDDAERIITLDMSESMEKHSVSRLIGSPPGYIGYDEGGQLTGKIRKRPYSVVVLDEIEKAHPDVCHLLLQVLEDGELTDSQGRKVNFRNTVVILTSNLGAQYITERRPFGFRGKEEEESHTDKPPYYNEVMAEVRRYFTPEFLNRLDEVILFNRLGREEMLRIALLMIDEVKKRTQELGIALEVTAAAAELIAGEACGQPYGARPLRRAVHNLLEDPLADRLLDESVCAGDRVLCDADGKLSFTPSRPFIFS